MSSNIAADDAVKLVNHMCTIIQGMYMATYDACLVADRALNGTIVVPDSYMTYDEYNAIQDAKPKGKKKATTAAPDAAAATPDAVEAAATVSKTPNKCTIETAVKNQLYTLIRELVRAPVKYVGKAISEKLPLTTETFNALINKNFPDIQPLLRWSAHMHADCYVQYSGRDEEYLTWFKKLISESVGTALSITSPATEYLARRALAIMQYIVTILVRNNLPSENSKIGFKEYCAVLTLIESHGEAVFCTREFMRAVLRDNKDFEILVNANKAERAAKAATKSTKKTTTTPKKASTAVQEPEAIADDAVIVEEPLETPESQRARLAAAANA